MTDVDVYQLAVDAGFALEGVNADDPVLAVRSLGDRFPRRLVLADGTELAGRGDKLPELVRDGSLPSSRLIADTVAAAQMATPPVFGARITGLTTGTEAAASTIAGSARTSPNYAAPWLDRTYRHTGAFTYLNGNTGLDAGACQNTTPTGVGPTNVVGFHEFELVQQRYCELWMRDVGGATQYLRMWVSKDGGPFQPHCPIDTPLALVSPGDGFYYLQPVDFGSVATWRILIEAECFTFGGVRAAPGAIRYPTYPVERMLVIADSYGATGGQFRNTMGYISRLARSLGLLPHITAVGGTGFSAVNGNGAAYYRYRDRIAADVKPHFATQPPAAIWVPGSINDAAYGFAGSAQLDTDIEATFAALQNEYPAALIATSRPGNPWRGNAAENALDAQVGDQIAAKAAARGIEVWDPVNEIPLTGTGYMGHETGDGNADTYSWTDHQHPSPAGAVVLGDAAARFWRAIARKRRPYSGAQMSLGFGARQAAPGSSLSLLANAWRRIATWHVELNGAAAVTYVVTPVGAFQVGQASSGRGLIYLDKVDYDISGFATKARLRATLGCNATKPFAAGGTITVAKILAGALSGAGSPAIAAGAAVSGASISPFNDPGANSKSVGSVTFDFPTSATFYLVTVAPSAAQQAGSYAELQVELSVRNT
jgi:lysophospholipase L1-like esterase